MKAFVLLVSFVAVSTPAMGQAESGEAAPSQPATGAAVTFADLDGVTIETRVVTDQVVQRQGREFQVQFQEDLKLVIGPGDLIDGTFNPTSYTLRGVKKGKVITFLTKLDRMGETNSSGGGTTIWKFRDGTLTFLRTFKEGALKRTIVFVRSAEGLTCTANLSLARENGVGSLSMNSAIDDVPLKIISAKQMSSTCRVTKPN